MRRLLLASVTTMGTAAVLWLGAAHIYRAAGPLRETAQIVIPHGGLLQVGSLLKASGVIRSEWAFRTAAFATSWQGPVHAAEVAFPAGAGLDRVLEILRFGRPVQHRLTIAEGLTAAQVANLLAREDALTGDVVIPGEGSVLPELMPSSGVHLGRGCWHAHGLPWSRR